MMAQEHVLNVTCVYWMSSSLEVDVVKGSWPVLRCDEFVALPLHPSHARWVHYRPWHPYTSISMATQRTSQRDSSFFLFRTGNSSHDVRDVLELSLSYSVGMLFCLAVAGAHWWSCGTCRWSWHANDSFHLSKRNKNPSVTFHENTGWLIHLGPYSGFL